MRPQLGPSSAPAPQALGRWLRHVALAAGAGPARAGPRHLHGRQVTDPPGKGRHQARPSDTRGEAAGRGKGVPQRHISPAGGGARFTPRRGKGPRASIQHKAPGIWMGTELSGTTKRQGVDSTGLGLSSCVCVCIHALTPVRWMLSQANQCHCRRGQVSTSTDGGGKCLSALCSAKGCASYHSTLCDKDPRHFPPLQAATDDKDCKHSNSLIIGSI